MTLGDLPILLFILPLCADLRQMWSDTRSVESLAHFRRKLHWVNRLVARSHGFARHIDNVSDSLVDRGVCSLAHTIQAILLGGGCTSLTALISVLDRLPSFRPCVGCSEQFLRRIHRKVKSLGEVALQV